MASVQANGITIEYEDEGCGEPMLLVMGLGAQLTDWPREFVDLLRGRGFRVIRFDNRDSGLSTEVDAPPPAAGRLAAAALLRRRLDAPYVLSDMAADAVGLLDALGIERAHVVGVSMGGMIAQTIAIDHPERVGSLTSIMSSTGNRWVGRPKLSLIWLMTRRPVPARADALEAGLDMFERICGPTFDRDAFRELAQASIDRSWRPAGTARQTAAILASPDRTPELRGVHVPTLVVHGLLDPLVKPSGGIATAEAVPGSRLVMFNDMAHDLPRTRWEELVDEITQIAARADTPATVAA